MAQAPLDLDGIFRLGAHGPDTFVGESPPYSWGRIYGGLVIAQALWAATQTVRPEHAAHSLHAYFILGGELGEPVRYEVDRVRNGRSFSTRRVVARQSAGAILTLGCSFQVEEEGPESQSATYPEGVPAPDDCPGEWDAGIQRRDVALPGRTGREPRSLIWARFPERLAEDPRLHACALAYLSDLNPMSAVGAAHPEGLSELDWEQTMGVSLDHALWFHRPVRADDWVLFDLTGHGVIRTRGLATGPVFMPEGTHVATVAQECLLRDRRRR
jgi:acyl-CoA thioesterase-2